MVNHKKQPSATPARQVALLCQVSSIHSCEMNVAEMVIQKSSTPGLPRQRTKPVQKAVCGCRRCSTVSMLRVVAGKECASRYFTPRKSIKRKLTSSMVALIHRESNKHVKPANA